MDTFKGVTEEMSKCGHKRTVEECHVKTNRMRMEYGEIVQHNATSGNDPASCPYFQELDQILKVGATIHPARAAHSYALGCCSPSRKSQQSQDSTVASSSRSSRRSNCLGDELDPGEGPSLTGRRGEEGHMWGGDLLEKGEVWPHQEVPWRPEDQRRTG